MRQPRRSISRELSSLAFGLIENGVSFRGSGRHLLDGLQRLGRLLTTGRLDLVLSAVASIELMVTYPIGIRIF